MLYVIEVATASKENTDTFLVFWDDSEEPHGT